MQTWMEGYTSDIEYTGKYYEQLNPDYLNMCAVLSNVEVVDTSKKFVYCELGCGQGFSALVNASLYPQSTFYAIDYNPTHIAHARFIAESAGLDNIVFLEKSFQELIDEPTLLPQVDFMVFHGIFTWVNDANRKNLIELCSRHVKSGGLVYNSYNAKPGWLNNEPIQQLIWRLSKEYAGGNSLETMGQIINTLDNLSKLDLGYFNFSKKSITKSLKKIKTSDANYVVHEYLHESWKAFYFTEVSEQMKSAKFDFLCMAKATETYVDKFMKEELPTPIENMVKLPENRELVKDLIVNTNFRWDIYIRGTTKKLSVFERMQWFLDKKWYLLKKEIPEKFEYKLSLGLFKGNQSVYRPIYETLLSKKYLTTRELIETTKLDIADVIQTLIFLYEQNDVAIYYGEVAKSRANELNKVIIKNVFNGSNFRYVVLPYLRKTYKINEQILLWLDGLNKGLTESKDLVRYIYGEFISRGLGLSKDGKPVNGDDMIKMLEDFEKIWKEHLLSYFIEVGVIKKATKKRKK